LGKKKPGVHVTLERDETEGKWSYVRTIKKREAPHLSSSE